MALFGTVESVEFLGKKGNQAIVTFHDSSSCRPCVDAYATSKEMRAKFVGHKQDQEDEQENLEDHEADQRATRMSTTRDAETLEERRHRQAAEREALLRQMQHDGVEDGDENQDRPNKSTESSRNKGRGTTTPFPIPFPDSDNLRGLSPYRKLEILEDEVLGDLVTPSLLQSVRSAQY